MIFMTRFYFLTNCFLTNCGSIWNYDELQGVFFLGVQSNLVGLTSLLNDIQASLNDVSAKVTNLETSLSQTNQNVEANK